MATVANKISHQLLDASCERIIAQFEQLREGDAVAFAQRAIGEVGSQFRPALVTEMARIELERNFVRDYVDELDWKPSRFYSSFPSVFQDVRLRSDLAFEHYRLARLHGKSVSRQSIGALYTVSGGEWKELPLGSSMESRVAKEPEYPRIGESFCGYPLIAELGRGALARVYLARQTDLAGRLVVLKISVRLNAEAEKLAKLQHTNIVPVYSVHRSPSCKDLYAICMPYLGSLTLADLLTLFESRFKPVGRVEELISTLVARRRSTLIGSAQPCMDASNVDTQSPSQTPAKPSMEFEVSEAISDVSTAVSNKLEQQLGYDELLGTLHNLVQRPNDVQPACQLIEAIASGMAYAHSIGIVHRDLKPENVLIANDGRPVILDFNLSDESAGSRQSIVGGTLPYMSMQQLQSLDRKNRVSPSDDVFAIGTIFYRLLTGQLPFISRSIDHLAQLIDERRTLPASVQRFSPHVPVSLTSIVMKCLSCDERERYPSAVELIEDLTCFRQHRTLRHAADPSLIERAQRYIRRNPVITSTGFIAVVAGIAILAIGGGWWWATLREAKLTQQLQLRHLEATMPKLLSQLQGPFRDVPQLQRGIADASELLSHWSIDEHAVESSQQLSRLSEQERLQALEGLGIIAFSLASAEGNLAVLGTNGADALGHHQAALKWNSISQKLAPQLQPACRFQRSQINQSALHQTAPSTNNLNESAIGDFTEADTPLAKMLVAQQSGDWNDWLRWADVMASEHPENSTAWFNLGSAHFTLGDFEQAWSCFDVSARLQADSLTSCFWRGVASQQLGNYTRALDDFNRCVRTDPTWVAARHNRALVALALQNLDEAFADASFLIESRTAGPRVWLLRAQIHALRGHAESAQADRRLALTADCQSADDWVAVGNLKIGSEPEKALEAFRKAQAVAPSNLAAWQNSAHVLSEQLNQPEKAIEEMERLIALRPAQASHYATRGILAARVKRNQTANSDAQRAGQLQPKAMEMLQIAGIYALLSQDDETAKREFYISQSLDWLRRALVDDPLLARLAERDTDLKAIQQEEVYQALISSAKTLSKMN